jgi:LmbE family N-acetylglucosaminyl deacetylase
MQESIVLANRHLGIKEVIFLQYPNLMLETVPLYKINKKMESLIEKYEPEMISTHYYGDLNRDHQITFEAVLTAARPHGRCREKNRLILFALKLFLPASGERTWVFNRLSPIISLILRYNRHKIGGTAAL